MRQIEVRNKFQIKQLLYSDCVLGIKDDKFRSFSGFQLWWYDKQRDICSCCQSCWSSAIKRIERHSLDKAAKILWRQRNSLFLRGRRLSEDRKLLTLGYLCN
jgi:hypothetical protein